MWGLRGFNHQEKYQKRDQDQINSSPYKKLNGAEVKIKAFLKKLELAPAQVCLIPIISI
jgi:hypothetical protein